MLCDDVGSDLSGEAAVGSAQKATKRQLCGVHPVIVSIKENNCRQNGVVVGDLCDNIAKQCDQDDGTPLFSLTQYFH